MAYKPFGNQYDFDVYLKEEKENPESLGKKIGTITNASLFNAVQENCKNIDSFDLNLFKTFNVENYEYYNQFDGKRVSIIFKSHDYKRVHYFIGYPSITIDINSHVLLHMGRNGIGGKIKIKEWI